MEKRGGKAWGRGEEKHGEEGRKSMGKRGGKAWGRGEENMGKRGGKAWGRGEEKHREEVHIQHTHEHTSHMSTH